MDIEQEPRPSPPIAMPASNGGGADTDDEADTLTGALADDGPAHGGGGLLDRDWLKALTILLTALAVVAVLWVIWQVISPILNTLLLFGLAAVLAFALSGPVDLLTPRLHSRMASIITVYLAAGVLIVGGLALLAGPLVRQATELAGALPRYASDLQTRLPAFQTILGQYGIQTDLDQVKSQAVGGLQQSGTDVLQGLVGTLAIVGSVLLDVVLALVISVSLLADGPRMRARALALTPRQHRAKMRFVLESVARVLGSYLRGQLALAAISGVLAGIGSGVLGLPYAVVLGVLAGLFQLVPLFGPILAVIPAVLVALFMPFPTVLWVLLYFVAIQQIESNVLQPRISGHAVGLHPLAALFALLAGLQLAGLIGGLFAVPIAGVVWVLLSAGYRDVMTPRPARRAFPHWLHR